MEKWNNVILKINKFSVSLYFPQINSEHKFQNKIEFTVAYLLKVE